MKTKLLNFQILRHGVERSDFFQGCGTSFTSFKHVQTGIGDTEEEAFTDAIECMATGHSFVNGELERIEKEHGQTWDKRDVQTVCGLSDEEMQDGETPFWNVSIRYNVREIEDNGLRAVEYTAPSCWASYLINGDSSGLDDRDKAECDKWIAALKKGSPVSCEDAGFTDRAHTYIMGWGRQGSFELNPEQAASFRYANGKKRIKWLDIPEDVRAKIIAWATQD